MPDGSKFDGVSGLRAALLSKSDVFVETVTEKLLIYALGRGVEYFDAPTTRQIARAAAQDDNKFSQLILGIVRSAPFQMRKSASDVAATVAGTADRQGQQLVSRASIEESH